MSLDPFAGTGTIFPVAHALEVHGDGDRVDCRFTMGCASGGLRRYLNDPTDIESLIASDHKRGCQAAPTPVLRYLMERNDSPR